jgi:hypothetical protein
MGIQRQDDKRRARQARDVGSWNVDLESPGTDAGTLERVDRA